VVGVHRLQLVQLERQDVEEKPSTAVPLHLAQLVFSSLEPLNHQQEQ
jgi:hypothetical protein